MNANTLRQFWSTVEATQTQTLKTLDDASLIERLLWDLQEQRSLELEDLDEVSHYIRSRLTLIRDLADGRRRATV